MTAAAPLSARDILAALVGFDTTSRNPNRGLIDWIAGYLADHGVESTIVSDGDPGKANLLATIGPTDKPGIALAGHTDVVPVDGQHWSSDPWLLSERDGKLYGRGTADMKAWSALTLARVPAFLAAPLRRPVHLAFSYDEETTCLGAVSLGRAMAALAPRPSLCIIGEPTGMKVVTGQKGAFSLTIDVRGKAAHSSLAPEGVNAVEYACRIVAFCTDMTKRFADDGPRVEGYDIPHTTVSTTVVHGGTALNIVPAHCRVEIGGRNLPEHDPDDILAPLIDHVRNVLEPAMRCVAPETGIDIDEWSRLRGYSFAPDAPEVQFVRALSGRNEDLKASFFTEAGIYTDEGGIPSIVCGPGFVDQAHKPDEFIALEQLAEGERFLDRLTAYLCRAA